MLDIRLGSHIGLAAGRQLPDALPILPGPGEIALQAPDIAALEQRRHGIRRLRQRLLDIGEGGIEAVEARGRPRPDRSAHRRGSGRLCKTWSRSSTALSRYPPMPPLRLGRSADRGRSAAAPPRRRPPHKRAPDRRPVPRPGPPGRALRLATPAAPSSSPAPAPRAGSPPPCIASARSARRRRNDRRDARRHARASSAPAFAPRRDLLGELHAVLVGRGIGPCVARRRRTRRFRCRRWHPAAARSCTSANKIAIHRLCHIRRSGG